MLSTRAWKVLNMIEIDDEWKWAIISQMKTEQACQSVTIYAETDLTLLEVAFCSTQDAPPF